MRHHPLLRTTTALTLSLSIVNGGAASAWSPGSRPGEARIWLAQAPADCAADPGAAGCAAPATPPVDGTGAPPEILAPPVDPGAPVNEIAPGAEPAAPVEEQKAEPAPVAPAEPSGDVATEPPPSAPEQAPAATETPAEPPSAPEAAPPTGATAPDAEPAAPAENQNSGPEPAAPADPSGEVASEPPPSAPEQAPTVTETPAEPPTAAEPVPEGTQPAEPAPQATPSEEPAAPAEAGTQVNPAAEGAEAPSAPAPATEPPTDQGAASPDSGDAGDGAPTAAQEAQPTPAPAEQPVVETAPPPTAEEQAVLDSLMAKPDVASAVQTLEQALAPAGETAAPAATAAALEGVAPPPAATTTQTITAETARSSEQDFQTKVTTSAPTTAEEKSGLSDLEKAGLVALGAVAVGMLVANNRVVANSGDRVVVDQGNGNLAVWKDDDALLRQPGVVERTQRYSDGSTLSSIARGDGSTVETVRDATGRVLRREIVFPNGQRVGIIDDTRPVRPVDISLLPKPRVTSLSLVDEMDLADLRDRLAAAEQPGLDRYSLAQVRGIAELRALAPELNPRPITFATASSAIPPEQAARLGQLAKLMAEILADDPRALFLVEGHSDAVGSAAYNLALSDRRAESVALALTQVFGIPPENLVVQGYGERYLKIATAGDEPRNRRVAVRDITWLVDGT